MPLLSPTAAAIVHAHLPPPNVAQDIAPPASPNVPGLVDHTNADAAASQPVTEGSKHSDKPLNEHTGAKAGDAVVTQTRPANGQIQGTVTLKWDFHNTFPSPTEAAIEAGVLGDGDLDFEQIKAIHEEHAREALAVLAELDTVLDARRRGIDPKTGKPPRTEKSKQSLARLLHSAPARLQSAFAALMEVYEEAFGAEAATSFRTACEAWHHGYEITAAPSLTDRLSSTADNPTCILLEDGLPVPAPLPSAIERRAFGTDDDGLPVEPSPEEVEEITRNVADQLVELLPASGNPPTEYDNLLSNYAQDFGEAAAAQLDRYTRAQSEKDCDAWNADHPWHYYERGDNCPPPPLDEIEADAIAGQHFVAGLPKNIRTKKPKLSMILADQEKQLADDERRYVELCECRAAALSDYDRNISSGGDVPLAWAVAISLKFRHIAAGRGRVEFLRRLVAGTCL